MTIEILERRKALYPSMPEVAAASKWKYICDACGRQFIEKVDRLYVGELPIASAMLSVMPQTDPGRAIGDIGVFHYCRDNLLCLRDASLKVLKQHLSERITDDGCLRPGPYPDNGRWVEAVKHDAKRGACNVQKEEQTP